MILHDDMTTLQAAGLCICISSLQSTKHWPHVLGTCLASWPQIFFWEVHSVNPYDFIWLWAQHLTYSCHMRMDQRDSNRPYCNHMLSFEWMNNNGNSYLFTRDTRGLTHSPLPQGSDHWEVIPWGRRNCLVTVFTTLGFTQVHPILQITGASHQGFAMSICMDRRKMTMPPRLGAK